jgi:hypothetical protein
MGVGEYLWGAVMCVREMPPELAALASGQFAFDQGNPKNAYLLDVTDALGFHRGGPSTNDRHHVASSASHRIRDQQLLHFREQNLFAGRNHLRCDAQIPLQFSAGMPGRRCFSQESLLEASGWKDRDLQLSPLHLRHRPSPFETQRGTKVTSCLPEPGRRDRLPYTSNTPSALCFVWP